MPDVGSLFRIEFFVENVETFDRHTNKTSDVTFVVAKTVKHLVYSQVLYVL